MSTGVHAPVPDRHATGQTRAAVQFFLLASGVFAAAIALAAGLALLFGRPAGRSDFWFPPAFAASTLLLGGGSLAMTRAVHAVRRERQRLFSRWLWTALAAGTVFMGVQGYALWSLLPPERAIGDASLGATPYVLMLASLHALHLSVAVLFVAFVTIRAHAQRYDHEYYWGVLVCAYFWHALGIAWLFILLILAVVAAYRLAL